MDIKEELKQRIMKVAEIMFLKNGYKNLRIDALVCELGISKRTFYEIFSSKQELVYYILDTKINDFRMKINDSIHKMILEDKFLFIEELKNLWLVIIEQTTYFNRNLVEDLKLHLPGYWNKCERYESERIEDFRKVYASGIKNGFIKPNISEEVFYIIHFQALRNLLKPEILVGLPLTVNEILSNFYEIILTGALTDAARMEYHSKI